MADRFIKVETLSGMADSIRKITNTSGKVNLGRFAKGEYEERFYDGKHTVRGTPVIPDNTNIAVFVPLTETENGTYDTSYATAIVSWDKNTEYDGTAEVEGMTLRYKKVKELTVPDDISAFLNPRYTLTIKLTDGQSEIYMVGEMVEATEDFGYSLAGLVFWVKEAARINEEFGVKFEDNSVYVSDLLMGEDSDYISEVILTAQGPKKDWYLPETVTDREYYDGSYILTDSNGEIVQSVEAN
jgi:hypothetical protein